MICFGCSKKSSQWDGPFDSPQHVLLLGKRKDDISFNTLIWMSRERSGSVVECLTRDQRAASSSLTGVTALWSLSKTHLS